MEHFRTVVSPAESRSKMAISDRILTIGSCFSDAIGGRMQENKFQCLSNTFGTLYSPAAIHKSLRYSLEGNYPHPNTYIERGEVIFNYDFHSEISALTREGIESRLRSVIDDVSSFLQDTKWLIITYGTAWVYARKDNGELVANCHKVNQSSFDKVLLSESDIVDSFKSVHQSLKAKNRDLRIIMTVSPVRHIKDTLELNSVSKGRLRSACYQISKQFDDVFYFPAFEMMIDDLRDYRFYKADMIHPNQVAEDYIWDKFIDSYGADQLIGFLTQWRDIRNAMHHKPFHENTTAHQTFLQTTLRKLQGVSSLVNVDAEIETINKQISRNFQVG